MKYYFYNSKLSKSIFQKPLEKEGLSKFCIDFEIIQIFRKFILF